MATEGKQLGQWSQSCELRIRQRVGNMCMHMWAAWAAGAGSERPALVGRLAESLADPTAVDEPETAGRRAQAPRGQCGPAPVDCAQSSTIAISVSV